MAGYTVLSPLVLLLSGWLAGAESASWALLQPVVARLDDTPQIQMQQGMLRTFGRVMPILLPLTSVLIVLTAVVAPAGPQRVLWVVAAVAAAALIAFTLTVNVPINKRTLTWDAEHPPEGWRADRHGGTPTRGCGPCCWPSGSCAPSAPSPSPEPPPSAWKRPWATGSARRC
jgi:hypothetical protein